MLVLPLATPLAVNAADNPPPVQTFYMPFPENDMLAFMKAVASDPANVYDPCYNYCSISVFSDGTLIYVDQWENGFDASIQSPLNLYHWATNTGGTQVWGDNNPTNGMPPGYATDVLDYGGTILFDNSVVSSNRTAIDFDAGDKFAATKPIALTRAGWASGSATLLAQATEVFDTSFWGTYFRAPVGTNMAHATVDYWTFEYVGFSIMAGAGGATVRVDKDANGVYETTNVLGEGQGFLVNGGVRIGGQILSDRPVQVELRTGDVGANYESRSFRLLPVELWSASATTPVSTPLSAQGYNNVAGTTVWLYNPRTNSISVNYITRSGGTLTTTPLTVPGGAAGGYLKQVVPDLYGARFINTNGLVFHALACINSTGTAATDNRTWDWGFTMVPQDSLTPQVLIGLGIGRDPTSSVSTNENASPVWVTPVGNGNTGVTVYVDYDADPATGPLTDANGYKCDVVTNGIRELDRLRIYNPSGDQSGMLIYVLTNSAKLAAAWGADPVLATPGAPGLDMGSAIPPLPLFVASKRSFLLTDNDNDGYVSPGDEIEYQITIENTGRQPVPDLTAQDTLPDSLTYITNTTVFVNASSSTSSIADSAVPPKSTRFPLDEGGIDLPESTLPVGGIWKVIYQCTVADYTNLPPGTVELQNSALVGGIGLVESNSVVTPIRGRIGDYVWWDLNSDGLQSGTDTGLNGVVVSLLYTNGTAVLDDRGAPITAVTTNDGLGKPGYYRLVGVKAGNYIVDFARPSGFVFTTPNADSQGLAGTQNSDAAIPSGRTAAFSLAGGETVTNVDAGLVEASSIGDSVWIDVDTDGLQDPGETGLNGVTVNLLDAAGDPVLDSGGDPLTMVTTNDGFGNAGFYRFEGLYAGDYRVEFVLPTNIAFTTQNADGLGTGGTTNSDPVVATGLTPVFTLGTAESLASIDAGVMRGDLVVSKAVSSSAVFEGDGITYTVVVSNAGPTRVTGITIADSLPAGVTYVTNVPSQGAYNSGSGVWAVGALPLGGVATLQLQATVDVGTKNTAITNTAVVSAADMPDPNTANNSAYAVIGVSALLVTKTSDVTTSVFPGSNITYTIVVSNSGALTQDDVVVTDAVPAGTVYVADSVTVAQAPPGQTVTNTMRDDFAAQAYTNNDGSVDWAGTWQETGESDGPLAGSAVVLATGEARVSNNRHLSRGADLAWATNAVLSFSLRQAALYVTNNVRDAFGAQSYANNNGSENWIGNWAEVGEATSPSAGRITVVTTAPSYLRFLRPGATGNLNIWRAVDLGNCVSAQLSLQYRRVGLDNATDYVALEVSTNNGSSWAEIARYQGAANDAAFLNASYDVSAYMVTNTRIRLRSNSMANNGDAAYFDNIDITYVRRVQEPEDIAYVDVSSNGTAWVNLLTRSGNFAGTLTTNYDITAYASTGTAVRFRTSGYADALEYLQFDAVEIESVVPPAGESGPPPILASGYSLQPGQVMEVRYTVNVETNLQYMAITNTALVTSSIQTFPVSATVVDPIVQVDLSVAKTADKAEADVGEVVAFTVAVSNLLSDTATDVILRDLLPAGFVFSNAIPSQGTYVATSGLWTVATITNGTHPTLLLRAYPAPGTGGSLLTNSAAVYRVSQVDTNAVNDAASVPVVVRGADLVLTKMVNNPSPNEGSTVIYSVAVSNRGPSQATGVLVSEPLTNGLTYVTNTVIQGSYNSGSGTWTVGAIPSGSAALLTLTAMVDLGTVGTYITNVSRITASDLPDPVPGNNTDSAVISVSGLRVIKTSDVPAMTYPGSNITYTITVTNLGLAGHTGITVSDLLPAGTAYVSGSPIPTLTNGVTLLPGEALTVSFVVQVVNPCALTQIVNTVSVTSDQQTVPITDTVSDPVAYADLGLFKNVSDEQPDELDVITYTVVVTNRGPAVAPQVRVEDLLPGGVTYASHVAGQGAYDSGSGVWQVGTIPVGGAAQLSISATVDAGTATTTITNAAAITAAGVADPTPGDNDDEVLISVIGVDVGVGKSVEPMVPFEKETVVYTVVVTNLGPDTATGLTITDLLPSGLDYVSHLATTGTYAPGSGLWTVGTLAAMQTGTLTMTVRVQDGTAGQSITNGATISTVEQVDTDPGNHSASVVVTPEQPPLDIFKSSDVVTAADPGDRITYTILVTNQSSQTQTGVSVTDPLPAGVSYVSASTAVYGPVVTNREFRDNFTAVQYTNNDGTLTWAGNWTETGDDGTPSAGSILVALDSRGPNTLRVSGQNRSIARLANLAAYTNANLSFYYRRDGLEANEYVDAQVSSTGTGGPWTQLARFQGAATDGSYKFTNLSIRTHIATNTAIRFVTPNVAMDGSDRVWFDDVTITVPVREYANRSGGAPSNLVTGAGLNPGEWMQVTFQADVPTNPAILSITNTASVRSSQMQSPRSDTVIDPVRHVDVGLTKVVSDENPGANDDIWFTITVTNRGAFTATGLQVRDYWPTNQLIFSNAYPSKGTYDAGNPTSHLWDVGTLAMGESASVIVSGRVDVAGKNIWITNRAVIAAVGQYDLLTSDNQSEVGVQTLVVVSRFEAFSADGVVWVEWDTASEVNTAGFRLYRQDAVDGPWTRVTDRMVRAVPGAPQGGLYRVIDPGAVSAATVRYRLEEVEYGGSKVFYGPFEVQVMVTSDLPPDSAVSSVPRVSEVTVDRFAERAAVPPVLRPAAVTVWGSGGSGAGEGDITRLKLTTRQAGVYFVSAASMAAELGLLENVVRTKIGNGEVILGNLGEPVRWRAGATNSGIYFAAEDVDTIFTDANVYWVSWTTGLQVQVVSQTNAPSAVGGGTFRDTIHVEQDAYALTALFDDPEADFWLWEYVAAGDPLYQTAAFNLPVAGVATGGTRTATLRTYLQGATTTGVVNEHHVRVSVNTTFVGEAWFDGVVSNVLSLTFNQNILVEGANEIEVTAVLDGGVEDSVFYVDGFDLEYDRRYHTGDGQLLVRGDTNPVVTVTGFVTNDIEVWRTTNAVDPVMVHDVTIDGVPGNYRVSFRPSTSNAPYWVFSLSQARTVDALAADVPVDLEGSTNGADYVVVSSTLLEPAATSLVQNRLGRGLLPRLVFVDDIYDSFSHGIADPAAIRSFLRCASTNWAIAPRYVVLAGAGTYDYRDCKGLHENLVPPRMIDTPHGLFSSDGWFTDFDNDDVPDVAIGRLPALTPAELQRIVDKIATCEAPEDGYWLRRVLMLADDPDGGGDFTASSEGVAAGLYEGDYEVWHINMGEVGLDSARFDTLFGFDLGAVFVNYFGHGGIDEMASEGLLGAGDVANLLNDGRLPVVTAMTCLIGRFAVPGFDCLGETLLLREGGGAAAVWAPSGLALNTRSETLARHFYTVVFEGVTNVLGDAILDAMRTYRDSGAPRHVLRVFNLLGDPAMTMPGMAEWKNELPMAKWKRDVFSSEDVVCPWISGNDMDPDEDDLPNYVEYAMGRSPLVIDTDSVVELLDATAEGVPSYDVILKYQRNKLAQGTECSIEVSSDLMSWGSGAGYVTDTQVIDDGNGQTETVWFYVRNPTPEAGPCFLRLKVTASF